MAAKRMQEPRKLSWTPGGRLAGSGPTWATPDPRPMATDYKLHLNRMAIVSGIILKRRGGPRRTIVEADAVLTISRRFIPGPPKPFRTASRHLNSTSLGLHFGRSSPTSHMPPSCQLYNLVPKCRLQLSTPSAGSGRILLCSEV